MVAQSSARPGFVVWSGLRAGLLRRAGRSFALVLGGVLVAVLVAPSVGAARVVATGAPATSGFSSVSAGYTHTCAVKASDGTVICWGDNGYGQSMSITTGASTTVGMRSPFDFTVTTAGYPTTAIVESGSLLTGVTFTDNGDGTADLAGTAAAGTAGSYPITITASDEPGSPAVQSFTLTVTSASSAPAITSATSDTETFGVPFSFTVNTTGYPAPTLTKRGALPSGVSFLDNGDGTATISGTPANAAVGVYTLTITAKSSAGKATQVFTLTVTKAPTINEIPTSTGHVGSTFGLLIKATGTRPRPSLSPGRCPADCALPTTGMARRRSRAFRPSGAAAPTRSRSPQRTRLGQTPNHLRSRSTRHQRSPVPRRPPRAPATHSPSRSPLPAIRHRRSRRLVPSLRASASPRQAEPERSAAHQEPGAPARTRSPSPRKTAPEPSHSS